jgi:hypothetical protein
MSSLNYDTIKCIWRKYNYYIMITLLPNKVKKICFIYLKFKTVKFDFALKIIHVPLMTCHPRVDYHCRTDFLVLGLEHPSGVTEKEHRRFISIV